MRLLLAGDKESNPGPQMTSYPKGTWLERYILTYSVLILYQCISLVAFISLRLLLLKVENLHENSSSIGI